ncbi:glycoside hydrolase family 13 protein [Inhella proteolytica]|uniref:Alpha-glucosidase C-terminal domain-containing protein n=1 Tax=Inhella proteolytica TaxID=2795029 RepID=A0A931J2U6_9BURK|nr:glycoside hydrolase family 13 protein [Inhella proteolytica]MBH9575317.1 alpha-glucosidase C-terminal domain-containing protein [Inhella proteolytica]
MKTILAALAFACSSGAIGAPANKFDAELKGRFDAREKDWRNGAIVYQVLPDRFAPPANLDAKRPLYPAPKILRRWDETPKRGQYLPEAKLWSHEIEFWGGDLQSLTAKLDHVQQLGADVLYLNPIHLAYTNHKYDAFDYQAVSPEFGTRADVKALAQNLHARGMKLVLDGVFNHMGRNAPKFKDAEANPKSPWRDWFYFGPQYQSGTRIWWLAENLPELNLELPAVQDHVFRAKDSVVRSYLREGVDGWRLDVAVDMGFEFLLGLTQAAHAEKPGSLVVGEIANYPKEWFPAVDGVMNFTLREILLRLADGRLAPALAQRMVDRMVAESGVDNLLKSWLMLDNHDTPRLATALPDPARRRLAQLLQFTLPGAPHLYYGSELGMSGGDDPEMRAPMRWDQVRDDNPDYAWTKKLIALRKAQRALRVGDYRPVTAERLFAFERHTDRARDTVIVVANPAKETVTETVMLGNSKLMNIWMLVDPLTGQKTQISNGLLHLTLAPHEVRVLIPELSPGGGYSAYKRVQ